MDRKLQNLLARERELKEDEQNILELLKMVREEMHKMQVEQLQWESMEMPVSEIDSMEDSEASTPQNQPLNENEVNAQTLNLEIPKLNELFMHNSNEAYSEEEESEVSNSESEDSDNALLALL